MQNRRNLQTTLARLEQPKSKRWLKESSLFEPFLESRAAEELTSNQHWRNDLRVQQSHRKRAVSHYNAEDLQDRARFVVTHLEDVFQYLDIEVNCYYCNTHFVPLMNLGQHLCRYHPGALVYNHFSCCGNTSAATGCTPCDHQEAPPERYLALGSKPHSRWFNENRFMRIPLELLTQHMIARPLETAFIPLTFTNSNDPVRSFVILTRTHLDEKQQMLYQSHFLQNDGELVFSS